MRNVWKSLNINDLVGENEISYSKIKGSENDFMDNLYDHGYYYRH